MDNVTAPGIAAIAEEGLLVLRLLEGGRTVIGTGRKSRYHANTARLAYLHLHLLHSSSQDRFTAKVASRLGSCP